MTLPTRKSRRHRLSKVCQLAAIVLLAAGSQASAELPLIQDAFIPQPPPGTPVAAGFFTITNSGDSDLIIDGASSPAIGKVEIHLTSVVNDVSRMEEQSEVIVAPGESLDFKHGSYHLMLLNISDPLEADQIIPVSLSTSQGTVAINFPVLAPGSHKEAQSHEMTSHDDDMAHGEKHGMEPGSNAHETSTSMDSDESGHMHHKNEGHAQ